MFETPDPDSTNPFTKQQPSVEERRIGFGPRLGAWALDLIGLWFVSIVFVLIFTNIDLWHTEFIDQSIVGFMRQLREFMKIFKLPTYVEMEAPSFIHGVLFASAISPVFYWLFEALTGASPGKRILKLQIRMQDGSEASRTIIALRTAIKFSDRLLRLIIMIPVYLVVVESINTAASLVNLVIIIGCISVLSVKKQALHDTITHTAVFRVTDRF